MLESRLCLWAKAADIFIAVFLDYYFFGDNQYIFSSAHSHNTQQAKRNEPSPHKHRSAGPKSERRGNPSNPCPTQCSSSSPFQAFGVLHAHKLTGYKSPNAYGHSPAFSKDTTYSSGFQRHNNGHGPKQLSPYNPNAMRSRLPVTFGETAKPAMRFCRPRNVSQYQLVDPNAGHTDAKRFSTMHKTFHKKLGADQQCSNGAILAERTKDEHDKIWQ